MSAAAAKALRNAAKDARGMHDPVAPDCAEWADWLDARAAREDSHWNLLGPLLRRWKWHECKCACQRTARANCGPCRCGR